MIKVRLMNKHIRLVKAGRFEVARLLLKLLNDGNITVYFDDISWEVDRICNKLSIRRYIDRQGICHYYL